MTDTAADAIRFPPASAISLNQLIAALLIVAFPNAMFARVMLDIDARGGLDSLLGTFGVSALIWLAMWMAYDMVSRADLGGACGMRDLLVLAAAAILILAPVSGLTWVALTGISFYFLATRGKFDGARRAFWVLLALCFSGFWSRLIFRFFMDVILRIDTVLVAGLTGTASFDNLIKAADGRTTLMVYEGCSSFNNMSLAFLGWILARSHFGTRGMAKSVLFVAISCCCVVLINTIRIGIIALRPDLYDLAHGSIGANIANIVTTIAIGAVSIVGARR